MNRVSTHVERSPEAGAGTKMAVVAWVLAAIYYFYQYLLRSTPSVMMPQRARCGFAGGPVLLRLFAIQFGGRRSHGSTRAT